MTHRLAAAFVVLITTTAITAAADPKADAKAHIDKATAFHAAGKFGDALAELQAAYDADPDAGLLYAIAQVQVKLDRCTDAIPNYEKFIANNPGPLPEKAAREAITACQATLARAKPEPKPEVKPPPEPKPDRVAVIDRPPPEPRPEQPVGRRAWYKDPVGGVLVGTGVIGGVLGVVFYRKASADIDAAEAAENYGTSEDLVSRASDRRRLAMIAGGIGGALVIGGIIRYVMVGGKEQRTLALVPTSHGAAVTLGGRW